MSFITLFTNGVYAPQNLFCGRNICNLVWELNNKTDDYAHVVKHMYGQTFSVHFSRGYSAKIAKRLDDGSSVSTLCNIILI